MVSTQLFSPYVSLSRLTLSFCKLFCDDEHSFCFCYYSYNPGQKSLRHPQKNTCKIGHL